MSQMPRTTAKSIPTSRVADLIARFDYEGVAHRIVETTLPTIPAYARMPDGVMMGRILDIVRHNLELFVLCLTEDREPNDAELAVLRESATQRGREGVPLQDMLHGYRLGARVAWQALIEIATSDAEQRALLVVADRIMQYVDGISSSVSQAYLDEREHLVSEQERWARALLDGLLDSSSGAEELQRMSEAAGFPLSESYRPFAVSIPGASAREHARIAIELRTRGVLALTEGGRVGGVAFGALDPSVLGRRGAAFVVGEPMAREDLPAGLDFVRLQVETALGVGRTGLIGPHDLLPELLLASSPSLAATLADNVLGPLEAYAESRSPELLRTLTMLVHCGLDRRETTARLFVHANTLDYRIRRIEKLIGRQLGDPEDLTAVVLALRQRQLVTTSRACA